MRKTLTVSVAPIRGARFGTSVLYLYRGRRLAHSYGAGEFADTDRMRALCYASRHGFTHVRFRVLPDWGLPVHESVTELATVRLPDSELYAQIPRVAWTGGPRPPAYRALSARGRGLVRVAFREAMRASVEYWGDGAALCYRGDRPSVLDNARIQWRRAIADAAASIDAAHSARLYRREG